MRPRITAIVPTYRRPQLLRRALESVLAQTLGDLQVLVLDNASGDETPEVVADLARRDGRVRYHLQPRNLGAAGNFQSGLEQVETPWFSFLSDDDFLLPGFYAHALGELSRSPEARFFCGQTVMFDPEDGSHTLQPRKGWWPGLHAAGTATVAMVRSLFIWTSALFAREVGPRAGPLTEGTVVDVLFMARAAARFPFVVSLQPCSVFTAGRAETVHRMSPAQLKVAYDLVVQELSMLPEISAPELQRITADLEHFRTTILGSRLKRSFAAGDWSAFDEAAAFLAQRPDLSTGKRLRLFLGSRRQRHPFLVRTLRRILARGSGAGGRRPAVGAPVGADDLLAIYGPALGGTPAMPGAAGVGATASRS
jgi:hypothetical protein